MFHKALWMRNYKQGKWAVWLFWLGSLFFLPFSYYESAMSVLEQRRMAHDIPDYHYYYHYYFNSEASFFQILVLIGLAALLIGWERNNQSIDLLFSMPFKRRDIFLSKWWFGFVHITGVHIVTYGLMYVVKKTTVHDAHQDFTDFSMFFLISFVTLTALYTFCLFVGTITGNFVSQAVLSFIFLYLPIGLYTLISSIIMLHLGPGSDSVQQIYEKAKPIQQSFETVSLPVPLQSISIQYDENPDNSPMKKGFQFSYSPNQSDATIFNRMIATVAVAIVYTLLSLLAGIKLYEKTPNEANGKILLYAKLSRVFVPCVVICCSLLGGRIIAGVFAPYGAVVFFYVAAAAAGAAAYFLLKKLMDTKLVWGSK
ncbi:MAG: ABC transporter permease [Ectobacillus sp.]